MEKVKTNRKFALVLVLIIGLLVRLYGIMHPLVDYHGWRQVDTASIAVNFLTLDFNIFRPQVFYDGPFPNVVQLELQVTPFVIALLAKSVGYSDLLARLVPVCFSLAAIYFVFRLGERFAGLAGGILSALWMSVLPLAVYFTRTVQPESFVLLCCTASVWAALRWVEDGDKRYQFWAILSFILVPLAKLTAVFMYAPLLFIYANKYRSEWKRYLPIGIWTIASLLITAAYYRYMQSVAESTFVSSIATKHVWPEFFALFQNPASRNFLIVTLGQDLLIRKSGWILFALGIAALWKRKGSWLLYTWFASALVYAATIGAIIKYDYYLTTTAPVFALLLGCGMPAIWRWVTARFVQLETSKFGYVFAGLAAGAVMVFFAWSSSYVLRPWYDGRWWVPAAGQFISTHTPDHAVVLNGDNNPMLLFYSRRPGYRLMQYEARPADIEKYRVNGATYYLPTPDFGMFQETQTYLNQFVSIESPEGYRFYKLDERRK